MKRGCINVKRGVCTKSWGDERREERELERERESIGRGRERCCTGERSNEGGSNSVSLARARTLQQQQVGAAGIAAGAVYWGWR